MCPCNKSRPRPGLHKHVVQSALPTVDPTLWGPALWQALHTAGLFATDPGVWVHLAAALKRDLPCQACSDEYNAWVASNPLTFPSIPRRPVRGGLPFRRFTGSLPPPPPTIPPVSVTVSTWLLALHNSVNTRLAVQTTWTLNQVQAWPPYSDKAAALSALSGLNGVIGTTTYSILLRLLS